ncbi:MAG TPA: SRPBCC family protein [Gemmatimonadaceae bacterium]|nr:SRPBCC family protein [Gemmatimonadaceae bacterium]
MSNEAHQRDHITADIAGAIVGGAIVGYAGGQRGARGLASKLLGAACIAGIVAPRLFRRVIDAGAARRGVHIRTTLVLDLPVHDVFVFCHDFENFPRIIQSLKRVEDFQDGRSHWEVLSPAGEVVEFDAVITKYVPNAVIAWHSVRNSPVECSGTLRFAPTSTGGTRVEIEVCYDPAHTRLAQAVRALMLQPREEQLRADLERANFYLRSITRDARSDGTGQSTDGTSSAASA